MGKGLINPYGTEWFDAIEDRACDNCGTYGKHEFILSERGTADIFCFCSSKCLLKFVFELYMGKDD